ncbi:MAG: hypothetical protein Q8Q11_00535 [bacterium]|nr:hypothetical protein [bacterium]MDZ4248446.1 hypothetical protein [Patescibacteria group bacterium]
MSKKDAKKLGGTKALWLVTAGLGLLFLAVWAADSGGQVIPRQTPQPAAAEATPDQSEQQRANLNDLAISDAQGRVDSRARVRVKSADIRSFKGADLRETGPGDPSAQLGTVIVLVATVDGTPVSELTYHAVAPDRVVFVKQETP